MRFSWLHVGERKRLQKYIFIIATFSLQLFTFFVFGCPPFTSVWSVSRTCRREEGSASASRGGGRWIPRDRLLHRENAAVKADPRRDSGTYRWIWMGPKLGPRSPLTREHYWQQRGEREGATPTINATQAPEPRIAMEEGGQQEQCKREQCRFAHMAASAACMTRREERCCGDRTFPSIIWGILVDRGVGGLLLLGGFLWAVE